MWLDTLMMIITLQEIISRPAGVKVLKGTTNQSVIIHSLQEKQGQHNLT